jgi:hypothetical protein
MVICLNRHTRLAGEALRFVTVSGEPSPSEQLADDLSYVMSHAQFRSLDPDICKRVRAHIAALRDTTLRRSTDVGMAEGQTEHTRT